MTTRTIAIDDGTSNTKVAELTNGTIQTTILPSTVQKGILPDMTGDPCEHSYQIGEQAYTVYEHSTEAVQHDLSYQFGESNRVMVYEALRLQGVTNEAPASVLCTLPIEMFYSRDGAKNQSAIEEKKINLMGEITWIYHWKKEPLKLIKDVMVAPESVPAIFDIRLDDQGQPNGDFTGSRFLCVDIGGTTTDIVVMSDKGIIVDRMALRKGALSVVSDIQRAICQELDYNAISHADAVAAACSKTFGSTDVSGAVEPFLMKFQDEILSQVQLMKKKCGIREPFFVVGGGANFMKDRLDSQAFIPDQPELSLARGLIKMSMGFNHG